VDGLNGNDNWAGTKEDPFKTIKKGIGALKEHNYDVARKLVIKDTTVYTNYNSENKISLTNLWGTEDHPVIITGEGSTPVKVEGYLKHYDNPDKGEEYAKNKYGVSTVNTLISGNNPRYVTIKNLHLEGSYIVMSVEGQDKDPYPKTGEKVEVAPKKLPFFKCGKDLKDRVDQ